MLGKQGDSASVPEPVTNIVTSTPAPAPGSPGNLARLLAELAALPADQRAALAALLAPAPAADTRPSPPPASAPAVPDDRCPRDTRGKG